MKILITGGTGLIGSNLIPFLRPNEIAVYTRNVAMAEQILGHKIHFLSSLKHLTDLNEYQVVINLAGEPIVGKKWSAVQKQEIESSRWLITENIVALIKASSNPPELLISGSAIGFYGRQSDNIIDESFTHIFDDFGHQLCERWEHLAKQAESLQTRVCIVRTGVVLSKRGGALTKMLLPFKLGLGGYLGRGDQYFSWIHLEDMLRGLMHLINNKDCHGVYNFTAPQPITNYQYSHELASALRRPCLFKIPERLLRATMGDSAELLLYGQRVVPKRLLESGYQFVFPDITQALDCLRK